MLHTRYLVGLVGLQLPSGFSLLFGLRTSFGVQNIIPESEGRGVVPDKIVVVQVVVFCTGPERQEVVQGPREVVAGMGVDGLHQSQDHPHGDGEEMQLVGDGGVDDWETDGTEPQRHNLDRMRVFCS